jgi:hypothetical protein
MDDCEEKIGTGATSWPWKFTSMRWRSAHFYTYASAKPRPVWVKKDLRGSIKGLKNSTGAPSSCLGGGGLMCHMYVKATWCSLEIACAAHGRPPRLDGVIASGQESLMWDVKIRKEL